MDTVIKKGATLTKDGYSTINIISIQDLDLVINQIQEIKRVGTFFSNPPDIKGNFTFAYPYPVIPMQYTQ